MNTVKRPTVDTTVAYYQAKIAELTMDYAGKQPDVQYFIRLNAYRDAIKYSNTITKGE